MNELAHSHMFAAVLTHQRFALCLLASMSLGSSAGCGGGAVASRPANTADAQAVATAPKPSTRDDAPVVGTRNEGDRWTEDDGDQDAQMVRRPLTAEEKASVIAAYEIEKKQAFAKAREQRSSEDRLTAGIHKRELEKIATQLRTTTTRINDARKRGKSTPRAAERAMAAARKQAELARQRSVRSMEEALRVAAKIEEKAQRAAARVFEENCRNLEVTMVADFVATKTTAKGQSRLSGRSDVQ